MCMHFNRKKAVHFANFRLQQLLSQRWKQRGEVGRQRAQGSSSTLGQGEREREGEQVAHLVLDCRGQHPDDEKYPKEPRQVLISDNLSGHLECRVALLHVSLQYIPCRITSFEEGAILCNFLPLLREYLPSTAEEIEADIISLAQSEGIEASCLEML